MLSDHVRQWLGRKIALAESLASGQAGGSYADGVLILSAVISGIAAELWPGEGFDKKRFVEVWATYSDRSLRPNHVSLPFLVESLRRDDPSKAEAIRLLRADCISTIPELDVLVVTGRRVDVDEDELNGLAIPRERIRNYSYGAIFYREFRSGYTHEYKTGQHADEFVMSYTRGDITYSNRLEPPYRRIIFDFAWLARVARSIVDNAGDAYCEGPRPQPVEWWLAK